MANERAEFWSSVYSAKAPDEVSWFQPSPDASLAALDRFGANPSQSLIDIGGGASSLVDALLGRGWSDVTVLDIAAPALEASRERLGAERAAQVHWEVADITSWQPARSRDIWHDRAVFHFLTEPDQRAAYRRALAAGLSAGGLLLIATFALDGPEKCSGLPVQRYDAAGLKAELGEGFELLDSWREQHRTPWDSIQNFTWCALRRAG